MRRSSAITAGLLVALTLPAQAQTRSVSPTISSETNTYMRIRDAANRPCVTLKSVVRPSAINETQIDHLIDGTNACPKRIAIKACYRRSTRCIDFTLPSYGREQVLLGVMSNVYAFQFDFTEKTTF